jgi:hypothetical protein
MANVAHIGKEWKLWQAYLKYARGIKSRSLDLLFGSMVKALSNPFQSILQSMWHAP